MATSSTTTALNFKTLKFKAGDRVVSVPRNTKATIVAHIKDTEYFVDIETEGKIERQQIFSEYFELEDSPIILYPGDKVRHKLTQNDGTIIGPAFDFGLRFGELVTKGTMKTPEPLYFIDIPGSVDYREKEGQKRKIINSYNVILLERYSATQFK